MEEAVIISGTGVPSYDPLLFPIQIQRFEVQS